VARQSRHTEPVDTKLGVISSYDELNRLLAASEVRGRRWLLERAANKQFAGKVPTDFDVIDLHRAMFDPLFQWAGQTRKIDAGPGGKVPVHWTDVRAQLRNLSRDAELWLPAGDDPPIEHVADFIARVHHRFEFIHPFQDTNGRTGRVLDHYLLWVTFQLAGNDLANSPLIEHFPMPVHIDSYYEGLRAGDSGDLIPLSTYYRDRIDAAFDGDLEGE
jgi:fido (protein-threonine AMPylation protein)